MSDSDIECECDSGNETSDDERKEEEDEDQEDEAEQDDDDENTLMGIEPDMGSSSQDGPQNPEHSNKVSIRSLEDVMAMMNTIIDNVNNIVQVSTLGFIFCLSFIISPSSNQTSSRQRPREYC